MANPGEQAAPFPALSRLDRAGLVAIAVALFAWLDGPVWRHLFDWDRAIGWSYAAVPALVFLALLARHRLSWIAWFLHSLELLFWKFAITAGILMLVLGHSKPQSPPTPAPMVTAVAPAKAPLPSAPAARGRVEGHVGGANPSRGALVYVSAGIADCAWPTPTATLQLTNDGHGFEPALAAAQFGETLTAVSADHRLHTLVMTQAGNAWRLNAPVLASGPPTPIHPGEVEGLVTATCAVHGTAEHASTLVLLRHPFFATLADDGHFAFDGVPIGPITLTALAPDGRRADASATVRNGETTRIDWALPAAK